MVHWSTFHDVTISRLVQRQKSPFNASDRAHWCVTIFSPLLVLCWAGITRRIFDAASLMSIGFYQPKQRMKEEVAPWVAVDRSDGPVILFDDKIIIYTIKQKHRVPFFLCYSTTAGMAVRLPMLMICIIQLKNLCNQVNSTPSCTNFALVKVRRGEHAWLGYDDC